MRQARWVGIGGWLLGLMSSSPAHAVPDDCDSGGVELSGAHDLAEASSVLTTGGAYDHTGASSVTGDFNGDGVDDLAVGSPGNDFARNNAGVVYVWFGPLSAAPLDPNQADVVIGGGSGGEYSGFDLANAGDVDGDLVDDLLIGSIRSNGAGVARLVSSTTLQAGGIVDLASAADAVFAAEAVEDGFGTVVGAADVNGDGLRDVVIGAPSASNGAARTGAAYVFLAPLAGTYVAGVDHDAKILSNAPGSRFGSSFLALPDQDLDGSEELLIGAPMDESFRARGGAVYGFLGASLQGDLDPANADVNWFGARWERAGRSLGLADDVDGDGVPEIWIGATHRGGGKQGGVFLVPGAFSGGGGRAGIVALWDMIGPSFSGYVGTSLATGDLNGDGVADLVLGGEGLHGRTTFTGGALIFHGPFAADRSTVADGSIGGVARRQYVGNDVFAGDLNDDGFDDLVLGAYRTRLTATREGAVAVFFAGKDDADLQTWYADADGDGWGDDAVSVEACVAPPGSVRFAGDCDDTNASFHPSAPEPCGSIDFNCDTVVGAVDSDGDGFTACGGDCNDLAADVNPAQVDQCGDAVDSDCDGAIDGANDEGASTWLRDADGDGFGDPSSAVAQCEPAFGAQTVTVGGDCDDVFAEVNPDAVEVCDGIDNNCDGASDEPTAADAPIWYRDEDLDGSGNPFQAVTSCSPPWPGESVFTSGDCDDMNGAVHPAAVETCDGIDNDCDGVHYLGGDVDADARAFLALEGKTENAELGSDGAFLVSDLNGDGAGEMLIIDSRTDAGAVLVTYGNFGGGRYEFDATGVREASGWDVRFVGAQEDTGLGSAVAWGDVNGDGQTDLVLGASTAREPSVAQGAVYVFFGPPSPGTYTTAQASLTLTGAAAGDRAGAALAVADLDADGFDDVIVGAPGHSSPLLDRVGRVHVMYGSAGLSGVVSLDQAQATVSGVDAGEQLGGAVTVADIDGNGHPDVVATAHLAPPLQRGRLVVATSSSTRWTGEIPTPVRISGEATGHQFGLSVANAGDVDGDGDDDVLVGSRATKAWLIPGDSAGWTTGSVSEQSPVAFRAGFASQFGRRVVGLGDVDGDGYADMGFTAVDEDSTARDAGAVYLVYGRANLYDRGTLVSVGSLVPFSVHDTGWEGARIGGVNAYDRVGNFMSGGDLNADGFSDILVTGAGKESEALVTDAGEIAIYLGGAYGVDIGVFDGSASDWFADADADGVSAGAPLGVGLCPMWAPTGAVSPGSNPEDCNDQDASIFPGALEIDGDGIDQDCDGTDDCAAAFDADGDGVCDAFDQCQGDDATGDSDSDGVCDNLDTCPGFDDAVAADADGDGVCNAADQCVGDDATGDTDADGVCDDSDVCAGFDDTVDTDADGVADGCDPCPLDAGGGDADLDTVCDSVDQCPGVDDRIDGDGDGAPDCVDNCPTLANADQADGDLIGGHLIPRMAWTADADTVTPAGVAVDPRSGWDVFSSTAAPLAFAPGVRGDALDASVTGLGTGFFLSEWYPWFDEDDFTYSAWLKLPDSQPAGTRFNVIYFNHVSDNPLAIFFPDPAGPNAGRLRVQRSDGVNTVSMASPGRLDDDAWHHVAVTKTDAEMVLYVDGVRVDSVSNTVTGQTVFGSFGVFMAYPSSGVWDVLFDEFGFFGVAASEADVQALYAAGGIGVGDGVGDACDACPLDNPDDSDVDGVCDGVDLCPGGSDVLDSDGDGVPDCLDDCPNGGDVIDTDGDGVMDCFDPCPLDDPDDSDGDGICDGVDACVGIDDGVDSDGDGVPNGCDPCPADNPDDSDADGVCDSADACPGFDDAVDGDGDGVADGCDACPVDNPDDSDSDGVCDSVDVCAGFDDTVDSDGDGVADGCDPCPINNPDDSDADGVCDASDVCPGADDLLDPDADGVPTCLDNCPDDANADQVDGDFVATHLLPAAVLTFDEPTSEIAPGTHLLPWLELGFDVVYYTNDISTTLVPSLSGDGLSLNGVDETVRYWEGFPLFSVLNPMFRTDLDFTLATFLRLPSTPANTEGVTEQAIVWFEETGATPRVALGLSVDTPSGAQPGTVRFLRSDGTVSVSLASAGSLADDTWHHVAVARRNGVLSLYVDGALVQSATDPTQGNMGLVTESIWLGSRSGSSHFLQAELDAFLWYGQGGDSADVATMYAAGAAAIEPDGLGDVCDPMPRVTTNIDDGDFRDLMNICPGVDDLLWYPNYDMDQDFVPRACDACDNVNNGDLDFDGICTPVDICPDGDDRIDTDGDRVPDRCDPCPMDNPDDPDGDGVCTSLDICPAGGDGVDTDGDGAPDACDPCPLDSPDDSDNDGVCDADDVCPGFGDHIDGDGDGQPDACDPCPLDAPDDPDTDTLCTSDEVNTHGTDPTSPTRTKTVSQTIAKSSWGRIPSIRTPTATASKTAWKWTCSTATPSTARFVPGSPIWSCSPPRPGRRCMALRCR